jgi:hypothetical protein
MLSLLRPISMSLWRVAITVPGVAVRRSDVPVIPIRAVDLLGAHRAAGRPDERRADAIMS